MPSLAAAGVDTTNIGKNVQIWINTSVTVAKYLGPCRHLLHLQRLGSLRAELVSQLRLTTVQDHP